MPPLFAVSISKMQILLNKLKFVATRRLVPRRRAFRLVLAPYKPAVPAVFDGNSLWVHPFAEPQRIEAEQ
jgi:hypothetical protein